MPGLQDGDQAGSYRRPQQPLLSEVSEVISLAPVEGRKDAALGTAGVTPALLCSLHPEICDLEFGRLLNYVQLFDWG